MSTPARRTRSRSPRLLAFATTFLVALGGLIAVPTAANAAPTGVTSATLDWGFKATWRSYMTMFGGYEIFGGGASATPAPYNWGTAASGSYDPDTKQGSFTTPGSVNWTGWHGIDITMSNLTVAFDLNAGSGTVAQGSDVIATFSTAGATVSETSGNVTVTGAASQGTAATEAMFANADYGAGKPLDPVSFSLNYQVPATPTTTTLGSLPSEVELGTPVDLVATVAPAAAGSVEFFNGAGSLGSAPVSGGVASLPAVTLPQGSNSITATFTSTDPAYAGSSTAAPSVITVTVPASAVATTTTVGAPAPAAPVTLGTSVELTAAVEQSDDPAVKPAGTVEFFSLAPGSTERVSLGGSPVDAGGVATLSTTGLAAGGHSFVAVFTPEVPTAFQSSEGVRAANYGVVDPDAPEPYAPGANAEATSGATATWNWSAYSSGWAKTAEGDATVNGQTFELSDGEVLADAGGAVISFEAVLRTTAYGTEVVELHDPALHLRADGSGVWVASVNSGTERVVVGTFSGVDAQPGESGTRTVDFDYAGTTAPGTWYVHSGVGRTDAWANQFVLLVPSAIRSFYYQTTDSAAQATKPASPLAVDFEWPAVSDTSLEVSPASPVVLGSDVTLTATVAPPAAEGTVEFFDVSVVDGETSLGTAAVEDGVATFTTDELVAGGHTFRAEFTSSNGFDASDAETTANFGVVDPAQAAVCTPSASASETLTGVTAEWDWSGYSSGWAKFASGNVAVNGQTFALSNGTATVSDDCVRIAFTGTLRIEAYQGFFPPHGQWVELVNPVLTIDSNGDGAWAAGVRSGAGDLNTTTSAPTVIAAIDGATFPDFSQNSVTAQVDLAYQNTTAPGTWYVHQGTPRTDAWSNAFILLVPSSIQSFFYQSTASAAQATKPPAPIHLDWALAAPTGTVNGQSSDARVLQGQTVTFSAGQFREGDVVSIVVNSDPVTLPAVTVGFDGLASQSWTVPADFELGAHSVVFSTGSGAAARGVTVPFTVEPLGTQGGGETPAVCVARAVTGGSMTWEFKQSFKNYINGPIAHGSFSGGAFTASGGAVNVDAGGIGRVNFQGSIVATGHGGSLDLRILNPSIQITGPNSGVLYGTLTQAGSGGYVAIANLAFASVSVSGGSIVATGSSAALTGAAAAAFGGFYGAGTELDPVSFSASLGGEVPCDATTDPVELAKTGTELDPSLAVLGLGALALLIGFGLVRMRRRAEA